MFKANELGFLQRIALLVVVGALVTGSNFLKAEPDAADKGDTSPAVVVAPTTPSAATDTAVNAISDAAKGDDDDDDDKDDKDDKKPAELKKLTLEERVAILEKRAEKFKGFHNRMKHLKFKDGKHHGKKAGKRAGKKAGKRAGKKAGKHAGKKGAKKAHLNNAHND